MVYQEYNQLRRYHVRPEPYLSTSSHFYDGPRDMEAPLPETRVTHHKSSTFAKLYNGSGFFARERAGSTAKALTATRTNLQLFPEPFHKTRTAPSSTYRGNGAFTVRGQHIQMSPYTARKGLSGAFFCTTASTMTLYGMLSFRWQAQGSAGSERCAS